MIIRFIIYGFSGWAMEILFTGFASLTVGDVRMRATTYIWMFPIYGMAVLLEFVHDYIRFLPWLVRGVIWTILIWAIEFVSGFIIKQIIGVCPWDYSGSPFSVKGYIRLDFAPLWFAAGLIFEVFHDALLLWQRNYL